MKHYNPRLILVPSLLILGTVVIFYSLNRGKSFLRELRSEYPAISISESINEEIVHIHYPSSPFVRNFSHSGFVVLGQGGKKRLFADNLAPGGQTLDNVLRMGDWIKKRAGSDTLLVYRIDDMDTTYFEFEMQSEVDLSK